MFPKGFETGSIKKKKKKKNWVRETKCKNKTGVRLYRKNIKQDETRIHQ